MSLRPVTAAFMVVLAATGCSDTGHEPLREPLIESLRTAPNDTEAGGVSVLLVAYAFTTNGGPMQVVARVLSASLPLPSYDIDAMYVLRDGGGGWMVPVTSVREYPDADSPYLEVSSETRLDIGPTRVDLTPQLLLEVIIEFRDASGTRHRLRESDVPIQLIN